MRIATLAVLAICSILPSYAVEKNASSNTRPAVADTKTVEFIEKKFVLKFQVTDKPVRIYEYFLSNEAPDNWLEFVEFQIYPAHSEGNEPIDHARRTAAAFKNRYPYMQFALLTDSNSDAVLLDFFYPESSRKEKGKDFLEFNAFKFFRDPASNLTMSFHYARNIEGSSATRTKDDVLADIKKTRQEIVPAMAKFPLYRQ